MGGVAAATKKAFQQYGYITLSQAERCGLHPNTVTRLVRTGQWIHEHRGLYRLAGVKPSWRGRMMAACLLAGQDAVLSHRSAAALWGLEGFGPPSTIDITVPRARRPRLEGARVHRRVEPIRTSLRDGIPVTPIPQTILDLCAVTRNQDVPLRAFHDVRRRKLVSSFELERCLTEHEPRRSAGIGAYRAMLERWLGRTPPGTTFASDVLELLVAAGLPEPEAEFPVVIDGRRYRIDLAYPKPKVAIECIGKIGHLNERAFEEDPVRNNDFAIDGWLQLQVTYWRVQDNPDAVVATVDAALACRGGA